MELLILFGTLAIVGIIGATYTYFSGKKHNLAH